MCIILLLFNFLVEAKSRVQPGGLGSALRHSCCHLLLRTDKCIRMPQKAGSPHVTTFSTVWFFLTIQNELRSIPWLLIIASVLHHAGSCSMEPWPKGKSWYFCVIWFSQKGYLVDHPRNLRLILLTLKHVPTMDWEILLCLSVHIYLKKPVTISIDSSPPTEQSLKYVENYLCLCCRCRNSWNLMEHSVPLRGFQKSIRRTSNHLSYLLGLLKVRQSLANLCFIFNPQNPYPNTWEHWDWTLLLPSQIVFWIILYCLLKLPLILPLDRKKT